MSAYVHGDMAYSFQQPMWHALRKPSTKKQSAVQVVQEEFRGAYPIFTRPVTVELNGEPTETRFFAIVRGASPSDGEERVFGFCTDRFHPLQPIEIAQSFDKNVGEHVETMVFLGQGEEMFISWKMPSCDIVTVAGNDPIDFYGIVRSGFDTLKGTKLFTSVVRPVCWNTITMAEGWAKQNTDRSAGKGMLWTGKAVNKNLLRDLGYWMSHVQGNAKKEVELLQGLFNRFAQVPISSSKEAEAILKKAYPDKENVSQYFPVQLRDAKEESTEAYNVTQEFTRAGILNLFDGAGTAITPDYWGLLNATTEFFCHYQPSKKPIAESVLFGNRQGKMMEMVKVLNDMSKNK